MKKCDHFISEIINKNIIVTKLQLLKR